MSLPYVRVVPGANWSVGRLSPDLMNWFAESTWRRGGVHYFAVQTLRSGVWALSDIRLYGLAAPLRFHPCQVLGRPASIFTADHAGGSVSPPAWWIRPGEFGSIVFGLGDVK